MFASVQSCASADVGLCKSSVVAYFLYLAACSTHPVLKGFTLQTVHLRIRVISNKIEKLSKFIYHNFVEKGICSIPYFIHENSAIRAVSRNK